MAVVVESKEAPRLWFSTRFFVAIIGFVGCAVIYSTRINLSISLVCMVNHSALESLNKSAQKAGVSAAECPETAVVDSASKMEGSFAWEKSTQGVLLGSFFWGYLMTQILGGWMAQRFGGTRILTLNVAVSVLITLLSPAAAHLHIGVLIALRIILGFSQGVTFPAFHTFWSTWSPPLERSILTSICYAGCQVGNLLTLPLSSFLCRHGFAGGWPSIYYVLGMFGALWLLVWIFYVSDSPAKQKFISANERAYIISSLGNQVSVHSKKSVSTPWAAIFKSLPVWAIIAGHFSADWATYTMLTSLPSFLKDVLQMDIEKLGLLSSVPYIAYFLCINISGFIADFLRSHNVLSTVNTRKLMTSIALLSQAVFLIGAGYCSCGQEYLIIALLTMGVGLSGLQYAGILINYMDVAPRYAGTILGIGNTLSCVSGILSPYAMGLLTPNGTRGEWLTLFWLTGGILVAGTLIYVIFAKGEVQPWALTKREIEEMNDLTGPKKLGTQDSSSESTEDLKT